MATGSHTTTESDVIRIAECEILALFAEISAALASLHQVDEHGVRVIYNDLKPDNIMLRRVDGRLTPCIIDFGHATINDCRAGRQHCFNIGVEKMSEVSNYILYLFCIYYCVFLNRDKLSHN